ncbi:holo-ACP synthase [Saccharopolyspora erythraea]|uniref:holo-ACP synthase n=1 Tax=Saccharopolyspora erythraea TaxID=1836 RepID=UPI001BAAEE07|nr:holo-ACP synthase [Saccharopolyspora erythraea]QUH01521.1 holo-ACP synthase [Saccharopolyspora erythraea]
MWVGVDVLGAGELDALLARPWFRTYTYAAAELAIADTFGASRAREFLAGRFAAKEAVLKALGTGVGGGITPRQVGILRDVTAAPVVELTGAASARADALGMAEIAVSISHKDDYVVAVAVGGRAGAPLGGGAGIARTTLEEIASQGASRGRARSRDV